MRTEQSPGSFRDPDGFIFSRNGITYRQVNASYSEDYDHFIDSGLYDALVKDNLLIEYRECSHELAWTSSAYKVIEPQIVPFISYPYEWCFSQIKDAALLSLRVQKIAMEHNMSLKDCSAYIVQFLNGKPIFIDTLSFEKLKKERPWKGYRQFCQHFLAPLSLMCLRDIRLNSLLMHYLDGIPLDLASKLLPFSSLMKFSLLIHIHLHARMQKRYLDKAVKPSKLRVHQQSTLSMVEHLHSVVGKLQWKPTTSQWSDYYDNTNYSLLSFQEKKSLVDKYLDETSGDMAWDLGANTGTFSRIAMEKGYLTIALDSDPVVTELTYRDLCKERRAGILPLVVDLNNPSPPIGWENRERMSILKRGSADVVLALALVHHLAISNNLPISRIAEFFSTICRWLIIEFIPKSDSQVQRLMASREDIFPHYTEDEFQKEFSKHFSIKMADKIPESERTIFLMEKR